MSEKIFDSRRIKTFSNCKELVKSMVGTRDGMIMYNEKFRLDLENTCYKADTYDELQQRIDKAIEYIEYIGMDATFDKVLIEILKGEDK